MVTLVKIGAQLGLNFLVPGLGSVVDFGEALYDVCNGDYTGAAISVTSGVYNLVTLGVAKGTTEIAKEAAKNGAVDTVKASAKEGTKQIGKNAAKEIAKGAPKRIIRGQAVLLAKQLKKDIGRKLGKEFGQNMIKNAAEQGFYHAAKDNVLGILSKEVWTVFLEQNGNAFYKEIFYKLLSKYGENYLQEVPKELFTTATSAAARKAATDVWLHANMKQLQWDLSKAFFTGMMQN